ncbi:MAG TPA: anion transporter [Terriglobales bacterium]|nr:anion transporter [Terriglobales bacterium]
MHAVSPVVLSDARILAAYLIFFGSYFVFALGKFPGMKIDRPGAAIIGAVLMFALRIVGPRDAVASIDFPTLVLLFSMMLIVANLHLAGFFDWLTEWIIARLKPHHLLPTVIFTSGLLSAFLVNDIICLMMTPFVLRITRRLGLAPIPYLLAIATASNIGSIATITGNPQNMLIGSVSGISYLDFIAHLAPVASLSLFVDWALIHWMFLRGGLDRVEAAVAGNGHREFGKKPIVVLALVLLGFFAGAPPAMVAAIGAALLLITRSVEPRKVYDEIDWGLLVFFLGLFIIVGGAERAGLTETLLRPITVWNLHRIPSFVAVTAVLSNIVSNVPAVMLLKSLVAGFPNPHTGWLALAMASTLAGNLTITGSIANIIVVEGARAEGVHVGFREYFRLGAPVTVATLVLGSVWLWVVR